MASDPWNASDFVSTYDHPIFENTGHVKGSTFDSEMELWWDSYGRVRLDKTNQDSPFVAYRVFTSNDSTDSPTPVHPTMDEFDLAVGTHIGTISTIGKIDSMLGVGYSGTHPFLNEKGFFGIGDITATHPITDQTSILLAVDYAGNNGLLPDVPLPGFAVIHTQDKYDFMLGFPVNRIIWRPNPDTTITAEYTVPFYTGSLDIEYIPWQHFGFYGNAGNFFQGFNIAREDSTNRQFFQVRSVEAGVRFIFDPWIDASIGIGYAFDQSFSDGFDASRSLRPKSHKSPTSRTSPSSSTAACSSGMGVSPMLDLASTRRRCHSIIVSRIRRIKYPIPARRDRPGPPPVGRTVALSLRPHTAVIDSIYPHAVNNRLAIDQSMFHRITGDAIRRNLGQ